MAYELRLLWHTNSDFYGIRTPTFMPYEPFLLGVGAVFNLLNFNSADRRREHKLFFSNFSGTPGISRQKVWFPWVSKDIPNFLAPTPSRGSPPPHPKISGPKCLGLGSFFLPDQNRFLLFRFPVLVRLLGLPLKRPWAVIWRGAKRMEEFRPRQKKYLAPPPQIPRRRPPGPSAPSPLLPSPERPPSWDVQ